MAKIFYYTFSNNTSIHCYFRCSCKYDHYDHCKHNLARRANP